MLWVKRITIGKELFLKIKTIDKLMLLWQQLKNNRLRINIANF
jgi:hypothetical protein